MQQYYFLFALALLWTIFAVVQDLKKREVANWLNFSLIIFALAYRAFYSLQTKNKDFFLLGLIGFAIFFGLAHALYYTKAFAGGDAKLLMGFGVILPYTTYSSLIPLSLLFLLLLFLIGSIYSIIYSVFIITKNKKQFTKEFSRQSKKMGLLATAAEVALVVSIVLSFMNPFFLVLTFISLVPIIYIYAKSLDTCMLKLLDPKKLTEGDWLEKDVRLSKGKTIKKTVHGLSLEDIRLLRKHKKKVLIKEGIPFTPAFLVALLVMGFVFLVSKLSVDLLVSYLF